MCHIASLYEISEDKIYDNVVVKIWYLIFTF